MSNHVVIESIKVKATVPMRHNTYEIKVDGKLYKSFNELSDDYAYTNAIEHLDKLKKKYERNYTMEVYRGF